MTKKTIKHFRLKAAKINSGSNELNWQKFYWTELNATEQNKKLNLT